MGHTIYDNRKMQFEKKQKRIKTQSPFQHVEPNNGHITIVCQWTSNSCLQCEFDDCKPVQRDSVQAGAANVNGRRQRHNVEIFCRSAQSHYLEYGLFATI